MTYMLLLNCALKLVEEIILQEMFSLKFTDYSTHTSAGYMKCKMCLASTLTFQLLSEALSQQSVSYHDCHILVLYVRPYCC